MERLDFCAIMTQLKKYTNNGLSVGQLDFLFNIFEDFISNEDNSDFAFDNGLVSKWMNGRANVSPKIISYYSESEERRKILISDIRKNIIPEIYDEQMLIKDLMEILMNDKDISSEVKKDLGKIGKSDDAAVFITRLLLFALNRYFIKRDVKTGKLIEDEHRSPMVVERIYTEDPPKPCAYFCGRDRELSEIEKMMETETKVFVSGIPGIGKSELIRAYVRDHRQDYTNILYVTYSGNLRDDIIGLDFVDDVADEDMKDRFIRHERFLRSLKADSLLIMDNFNTIPAREHLFSSVMKYNCRIIFTTRSRFEGYPEFEVKEIKDKEKLMDLAGKFYEEADEHREEVSEIIDLVHSHTFTVELASRLLQKGILSPDELSERLKEENIRLQSTDNISMTKDGEHKYETYYGHIHMLFALYKLGEKETDVMRYMTFAPPAGVHAVTFAGLIGHKDMNVINTLIETGFIRERPHRTIALHPMIREVAVADMIPSTENCQSLLDRLMEIFSKREEIFLQFPTLFSVIMGMFDVMRIDDNRYFLSFLESAFLYMKNYRYEDGEKRIIHLMEGLVKDKNVSDDNDKALLAMFKSYMESLKDKDRNALKMEKMALTKFERSKDRDSVIEGAMCSDMAALCFKLREYEDADNYAKRAKEIFDDIGLKDPYELMFLESTRILLLAHEGNIEKAMEHTDELKEMERQYRSEKTIIYAMLEETAGLIKIYDKKAGIAEHDLQHAREIYADIFNADPELIEKKDNEIQKMFAAGGYVMAEMAYRSDKEALPF